MLVAAAPLIASSARFACCRNIPLHRTMIKFSGKSAEMQAEIQPLCFWDNRLQQQVQVFPTNG
jgi:hypothetical protein